MRRLKWDQVIALLISGAGIGWLLGLAVSPVVSIVISSLMGTGAAVLAVLTSVQEDPEQSQPDGQHGINLSLKVNVWPLAMLVLGIVLGAVVGIMFRTYGLLSPSEPSVQMLEDEVQMWVNLGIEQEEVVQTLFNERIRQASTAEQQVLSKESTFSSSDSVLFSGEALEECAQFMNLIIKEDAEDLRVELYSSANDALRALPDIVTDDQQLFDIVENVVCFDTQ